MNRKIIQKSYVNYKNLCNLHDISGVQEKETRQAYFAGFSDFYGQLINIVDSEKVSMTFLNDIRDEVKDFISELTGRGK